MTPFSPTSPNEPNLDGPRGTASATVIHAGMTIEGKLRSNGDVVIEGSVTGDITGHNVTIASGAKVRGTITADMVKIDSQFEGTITCRKLQIDSNAQARGEFNQNILAVAFGARFEGNVTVKQQSSMVMND